VVNPIRHLFRPRSRISKRIVGEPLEIGERTIRPVVRVSGWRSTGVGASGAGVQLRARPEGVIILERHGREHLVPAPDNTRLILWGLAGVALMVALTVQVAVRVLR
jgi:hypothetical protein